MNVHLPDEIIYQRPWGSEEFIPDWKLKIILHYSSLQERREWRSRKLQTYFSSLSTWKIMEKIVLGAIERHLESNEAMKSSGTVNTFTKGKSCLIWCLFPVTSPAWWVKGRQSVKVFWILVRLSMLFLTASFWTGFLERGWMPQACQLERHLDNVLNNLLELLVSWTRWLPKGSFNKNYSVLILKENQTVFQTWKNPQLFM